MLNSSLAVASFFGFIMAAGCTLIADVDRTKIPTDTGPQAGETGMGGSTGGTGQGGKGGTGGTGQAGMAGGGDEAGTGGTNAGTGGGDSGGTGAMGGTGGTGTPTEKCDPAKGTITLGALGQPTYFSDGNTFTLGDGVNNPMTFEFDLASSGRVHDHSTLIAFDGTEDNAHLAVLITEAINKVGSSLNITASTTA
ncbi:MAG TPA: hypothetical protein VGQ57_15610, partial [Polyangiaceae bacterium]|nr:hypothetical protein [Polyangiaceae bacterium]